MAFCKHGKLIHPDDSCTHCQLAQLETETLELARVAKSLGNNISAYLRKKELPTELQTALGQLAISKLMETKDGK